MVIRAIAEHLNRSEGEVLSEVARRIKVGFVGRLSPLEPEVLSIDVTLGDLRRAGAIVTTWEGKVTGIACIDPVMVRALLLDTKRLPLDLPISLAPWELISRTLAESEELWLAYETKREREKRERELSLSQELLKLIIREVEDYNSFVVILSLYQGQYCYKFSCADGRKGEGDIDPEAGEMLSRVLALHERLVINDPPREISWIQGSSLDNTEWCLSWHELTSSKAEREEIVLKVVQGNKGVEKAPGNEIAYRELSGAQKYSVLIIDDNASFAAVVGKFLERHSIKSSHAQNGKLALALLTRGEYRPDLIVCDIHMPFMNGEEVLSAVKALPSLEETPFVMLTSDDNIDTEVRVVEAGAHAYINKSQDPRILAAHVLRILKEIGRRRAA